jgi:hypothetical protein
MSEGPFKVFIQSNRKQLIGAELAKFSIIQNSKNSSLFDVEIMLVEDNISMTQYEGKAYFKGSNKHIWTLKDLQSFTVLRFLPPQLMSYKGRAIVIDPDVFATSGTDIMDLFQKDMQGKAILACSAGPSKFKSSVMLLDCKQLKSWRWEEWLTKVFSGQIDYRKWMNLELEDQNSIGILEDQWNHCDKLDAKTKLIHFTNRITQPWKTGLNVDFTYDTPSRYSFLPPVILGKLKNLLHHNNKYESKYQLNPDKAQENFFFELLVNGIKFGAISNSFLEECVKRKYVREDLFLKLPEFGQSEAL